MQLSAFKIVVTSACLLVLAGCGGGGGSDSTGSGSTSTSGTSGTSSGGSSPTTGSSGSGSTSGSSSGSGSSSPSTGGSTGTSGSTSGSGGSTSSAPAVGTATTSNSDGPSAPAGGILITGQTASSISMSWQASAAGTTAVKYYKVYRNGSAYATTTAVTYTDSGATNATVPAYTGPATAYTYAVSAVDANAYESAQTTQSIFWVFYNGKYNWGGFYDFGGSTTNTADTGGTPEQGAYDIGVAINGQYAGILAYAGDVVPTWDLESSAFNYLTVDLEPTVGGQVWQFYVIDRVPSGDLGTNAMLSSVPYGTATPGKWTTYKIPLAALGIGRNALTASISGSTMTVSAVSTNVVLSIGGFITGPGIAAGTYISNYGTGTGGTGTYTLTTSQNVSSTTIQYDRTNIYKVCIQDETGMVVNSWYVDNFGFTAQ